MANSYDYDLLVIGCGPAGQRAAVQAAKLQKRVAIVDRLEVVGGVCVNLGTIPSKSFKEAVVYLSGYRQRSMYGADYQVIADIEMADLTFRCQRIMQSEIKVIHHQLKRNQIEVISGHGRFLDDHTIEVESVVNDKRKMTAEKIVVAIGGAPYRPAGIEFDGKTIFDSDDILSMEKVPRKLTVVGGGVVGTEYGSMFAALGVEVTIVDARNSLLGFLDNEIIECLQYQMRSMGAILRLNEEVESCARREDGQVVTTLKSGKVITSDCVLYSAGRRSPTDSLGLDNVNVESDDRGRIKINESYQTTTENIYAAGDVIGFPGLASSSSQQGRLAACNAFGLCEPTAEIPLPYGIYSIPEISYVGFNERELTEQGVPYEVGMARYREIARGLIIGDEEGMLKVLFHRDTQEVLGVHIIGEHATELVHVGQAVIALKGNLSYLRDAVFNYPTLAECYKVAAYDGYNKLRS